MLVNLGRGMRAIKAIKSIFKWFQADSYKADSVSPSLILDFANNRYAANSSEKNFSDILTFSRGSTGTYFDSAGIMKTAAIDTPRFDYDPATGTALGLLLEESRTNQARQSSINAVVAVGTLTGGQADIAGGNEAYLYTEPNGVNGSPQINYGTNTVSGTSGQRITYSVYVKPNTCYRVQLFINAAMVTTADGYANFYLNGSGSVSLQGAGCYAASIQKLANGWYRIVASFLMNATGSGSVNLMPILIGNEYRASSYDLTGRSFYIFGAQAEIGSFVTSYIPTTTAAVTRSADFLQNTGSNNVPFASWYNSSAGTVYTDFNYYGSANAFPRIFDINDAVSNSNLLSLLQQTSVQQAGYNIYSASAYQGMGIGAPDLRGSRKKFAAAVTLNNAAAVINGGTLNTDTSLAMPVSLIRMDIGNTSAGTQGSCTHISELRFYGQRITNSELQRITA